MISPNFHLTTYAHTLITQPREPIFAITVIHVKDDVAQPFRLTRLEYGLVIWRSRGS